MKATAKAPANIAFIKYWGRKNEALRLPLNSSISMNLSNAYTVTTVDFSPSYIRDEIEFKNKVVSEKDKNRIIEHLDRIRKLAKIRLFAKVVTENNFPQKTGIASSSSGFAALTKAVCTSLDLNLTQKELSILARLASGSACRSIPDGFVEWRQGDKSEESFACSLYDENYWDLRDIVLVLKEEEKKIPSSDGHRNVQTSPLLKKRLNNLPKRIERLKKALKEKDFYTFGKIIEEEALEMHSVMKTQTPPLFYLNRSTIEIIEKIKAWRKRGLFSYFTLDAGPNIHLVCEGKDEKEVLERVKGKEEIKQIIVNKPSQGASIISKHLF